MAAAVRMENFDAETVTNLDNLLGSRSHSPDSKNASTKLKTRECMRLNVRQVITAP